MPNPYIIDIVTIAVTWKTTKSYRDVTSMVKFSLGGNMIDLLAERDFLIILISISLNCTVTVPMQDVFASPFYES